MIVVKIVIYCETETSNNYAYATTTTATKIIEEINEPKAKIMRLKECSRNIIKRMRGGLKEGKDWKEGEHHKRRKIDYKWLYEM